MRVLVDGNAGGDGKGARGSALPRHPVGAGTRKSAVLFSGDGPGVPGEWDRTRTRRRNGAPRRF
ncbi:unnamed protein product [Chondrus crispus]|uniref:Uncharacterized protein n=1 Tax=Chondrus crispus TaxID=2769 RepID=R7Q521_CHOCR|nr:unnamed protein product [Chondrus crispus]CDF33114.1 unnamed protein product [Chondrus crispus]|eukprot:XP_005712917.1 unnamed protein product [Chondrus crispus]